MNQKICYFFLLLSCFVATSSWAQSGNKNVIYQIQLAAYEDEVDWDRFKNLKDVGFVTSKPIDPSVQDSKYKRVFVGKYIGDATIRAMLNRVQSRGFRNPTIVRDNVTLQGETGADIQYTIQLGAFNQLNIQEFLDIPFIENVYILLEGGKYRMIYGLYVSEEYAQNALKVLQEGGFTGLVKKFR